MIGATTAQVLELLNVSKLPAEMAARMVPAREEKRVALVTGDSFCREHLADIANHDLARLTATDLLFLRAAHHELIELTVEHMHMMMRRAKEISVQFSDWAQDAITEARARNVREMRVHEKNSWRKVALRCFDAGYTTTSRHWNPPDNQLMGMALCEHAAMWSDEDYMLTPWN